MSQSSQERPAQRTEDQEATELDDARLKTAQDAGKSALEHVDDADGLLDEIDEVLEANAEEFVKSYIQKGGQ